MVSGRRPLWIDRIKKKCSLNKFKKCAKRLEESGENIKFVLKGNPREYVYKVTVETMEGCNNGETPFEDIWVPDELAEATGEMLEKFEDVLETTPQPEIDEELEAEEPSPEELEEVERVYEELKGAEPLEPEEEYDAEEDKWMDDLMEEVNYNK